jgi:hypothetical protein
MSDLNRRQFLRKTLANLVQAAGSVTLASAAISRAESQKTPTGTDPGRAAGDVQQRADELAAAFGPMHHGTHGEQAQVEPVQLRSRRHLRPGRWPNGIWRNGGWRNFPFLNGAWPNGPWRNGPWPNGGWNNGGWRNW